MSEQSQLVSGAAGSALSAVRLKQRLAVLQRYLTAVSRSAVKEDVENVGKKKKNKTSNQSTRAQKTATAPSEKAALGLARVGSRAALSFAFAFLRRAWRSGEDQDLCSELLTESLEALQALPEASLFNTEDVSKVWLEVVERSAKFLHQVVVGAGPSHQPPLEDRHLALALLCELALQRANLSEMLSNVMLLIHLWSSRHGGCQSEDNRISEDGSAAPLVPLVRRLEMIPEMNGDHQQPQDVEDEDVVHPTQCFLQYLDYPEDETSCIDLQQAAVVIMSHLDRLARPLCPLTSSSPPGVRQSYGWWGEGGKDVVAMLPGYGVVSLAWSDKTLVFISASGTVHSIIGGEVTSLDITDITDRDSSPVEVVATLANVVLLTSIGEVWWGATAGPLQLVTQLVGKRVVQLAAGYHHSAAVTDMGQLYTWTDDTVSCPTLVSALSGHNVVQVACGHGPDHHMVVLTDAGFVYTWTGAGTAGVVPKLVDMLSGLEVVQLAAGAHYSAAVTRAGELYTWGQLGSREEYIMWPRHVSGVSVSRVAAGPCHLVMLDTAGHVWGWGDNDHGQLGSQLATHVTCPTMLSSDTCPYIGMVSGQHQVITWTSHSTWTLPQRAPFVIDICEQTFRYKYFLI